MTLRRIALRTAVVLLLNPTIGWADGLFTPFIGGADSQMTYGFMVGGMGRETVGVELDFSFTPDFFGDDQPDIDNNLLTVMGNLIVGAPIGAVRPYGSGGIGLIRTRLSGLPDLIDFSRNDFGINFGGGLMGFFGESTGVRGDVRYFRSLQSGDEGVLDFNLGTFDYWRATVGVVFSF